MQCILSTQSPAEERGGTGLAVGHLSTTPCMQLFCSMVCGGGSSLPVGEGAEEPKGKRWVLGARSVGALLRCNLNADVRQRELLCK